MDAYPGDTFNGRIARVAPVLDPATRTASIEIEIPNRDNRLKPGMYARISLTVEERKNALVAPKNAVIDFENKRGVWMPNEETRAQFVPVELGIEDPTPIEIMAGLKEGDRFVTTGAAAVRNNDQLIIAGEGWPAVPALRVVGRRRPARASLAALAARSSAAVKAAQGWPAAQTAAGPE